MIRAFPLESELPTTFELTEHEHIHIHQAWQRLLRLSEQTGKNKLSSALQTLFDFCHGLNGTRTALVSFLYARTEWRAYTQHKKNAALFANEELIRQLGTADLNPNFTYTSHKQKLQEYYQLLSTSPTKTYQA